MPSSSQQAYTEPYQSEIRVHAVQIISPDSESGEDVLFSILDSSEQGTKTNSGQLPLDFIEFTESLGGYIEGSIIFDGSRNQFELIQGRGNELLRIVASSLAKNQEDETNTELKEFPLFSIVSIDDVSNLTELEKGPEGNKIRKIKISFCTLEAAKTFDTEDKIPFGFIGKISSGAGIETKRYLDGQELSEEDEVSEEDASRVEEVTTDLRGLVEFLGNNFFSSEIESEPTLNDIWVHPNINTYPTRKLTKNMSPIQLLNYAKEYAVSAENPAVVNYMFWHDLNGWHFKSATSMISEYAGAEQENLVNYNISSNIPDRDRIYSLDIIRDYSEKVSFYDLALYSYYIRYSPDYELSPYHRLMGDREKYNAKKIIFNYKDYINLNLVKVEEGHLIPDLTRDDLFLKESPHTRIHDNIFGWQNMRGFDDDDEVDNFILIGEEVKPEEEIPEDEDDTGEEGGEGEGEEGEEEDPVEEPVQRPIPFVDFSGYQPEMFQEMFDCTPLKGDKLKTIVEKIKRPIWEAKKEYRELLHKKEKYNLYKYSVCCDVADTAEEPIQYALLKGHQKIEKNIYRYDWAEVALLPKAEVGNFLGIGLTADDIVGSESGGFTSEEQFYSATVDELNQIRIPDTPGTEGQNPSRPMQYQFIKFPSNPEKSSVVDINYVHDLSGEFLILPPESSGEDGPTFEFENKVTDAISKYFAEAPYSGLTLTFHNNHYSPFLVVEKPNAIRGTKSNPSGAYNLNEIMNRRTYNENTYPSISGGNILYYQGKENSPYNMPFPPSEQRPEFPEVRDEFVGPGINASKKEETDYPDAFTMMPVGSYRRIEFDDGVYGDKLDCSAIPIGQIVRISTITYDDLVKYGLDTRDFASREDKKIYYFNATNAHDGMCDGTCSF